MGSITPKADFLKELQGLFDAKGKVAYLPGGYGGIGEAIAWGLAMSGARIAISGRSREKAEALAGTLREAGFEALGLAADVNSVAETRDAVDQVASRYKAIDILVNCVGIQREEPLLEVTEEAFDEVYRVLTPRFLAGFLSMPLLAAMFSALGVYGGWFVGVGLLVPVAPHGVGILPPLGGQGMVRKELCHARVASGAAHGTVHRAALADRPVPGGRIHEQFPHRAMVLGGQ